MFICNKKKICYYCDNEIPKNELTRCIRCNIKIHYNCFQQGNNKKYTECPNCQKIGTLGISNLVIDNYGLNCKYLKECKYLHEKYIKKI